jgi:hypothetical protein
MRLLLVLILLVPTLSFAGLEKLTINNLNLDYVSPKGTGTVDKVEVGVSKEFSQPVEVEKLEDSLLLRTGVVEFQWMKPWSPLMLLEKIQVENVTLKSGHLAHALVIPKGTITYKGDYKILNGSAYCEGTSEQADIENRVLEDCRENMKVEADRFDVPFDFFLIDLLAKLPQQDEEQPLKNFTLTVKDGDFYMYALVNYVVKAGLRTWGAIHYEDDLNTMVIRVDTIKFGYIPVTNMVMKELKERIKSPDIKVEPPFIRIKIK